MYKNPYNSRDLNRPRSHKKRHGDVDYVRPRITANSSRESIRVGVGTPSKTSNTKKIYFLSALSKLTKLRIDTLGFALYWIFASLGALGFVFCLGSQWRPYNPNISTYNIDIISKVDSMKVILSFLSNPIMAVLIFCVCMMIAERFYHQADGWRRYHEKRAFDQRKLK